MMKSILILDADGTQTLPIAESLFAQRYILHGFYNHRLSYGYGCRYIKYKCIMHYISEDDYLQRLLDYIKKKNIDVIFPMSDRSAVIVSRYKFVLSQFVKFVISDYNVFCLGYDKNALMHVCQENGIPHPYTIDLDIEDLEINESVFPALIKPNITTGGRGMTMVHTLADFYSKICDIEKQYGSCHLQEFIRPGGKQIKVQLFLDKCSNLIGASVQDKQRYFPITGGSSSCNETIQNKDIVNTCYSVLKQIGWVGFADFDLIEDPKDGIFKIMELNPRMPACIKSSIKAGMDYARIYVDCALGNSISSFTCQSGYKLRHIGFEILWFIYNENRFKAKPSWFQFLGKHLFFQDFSWKDPMPFFLGTLGNVKKQFSPTFRSQKSNLY